MIFTHFQNLLDALIWTPPPESSLRSLRGGALGEEPWKEGLDEEAHQIEEVAWGGADGVGLPCRAWVDASSCLVGLVDQGDRDGQGAHEGTSRADWAV